MHQPWYPDVVFAEHGLITRRTRQRLQEMGYRFRMIRSWSTDEAIVVNPRTHELEGANDRRSPAGLAAGY